MATLCLFRSLTRSINEELTKSWEGVRIALLIVQLFLSETFFLCIERCDGGGRNQRFPDAIFPQLASPLSMKLSTLTRIYSAIIFDVVLIFHAFIEHSSVYMLKFTEMENVN